MADSRPPNLLLISVGSILGSMVISGFLLGFLADYFAGTAPLFLLLFGLLGMVGGSLKVYKLLIHPDFNNVDKH